MNVTRRFLVSALILGFVFAQGVLGQTLKGPTIPQELGMTVPPISLIADNKVSTLRNLAPANLAAMPKTVTVTINYLSAGETNYFGDVCVGWPANAQAAFTYAANVWGTLINSSVPIVINAAWANLGSGVLGHAGPRSYYKNFGGGPQADTWYAVSTANALAETDLNGSGTEEIVAGFNAQFDWYFGTDGNCPSTQYDLVSVVMHEIGHGLGFLGSMYISSGLGYYSYWSDGLPIIYDRYTENGSGTKLITFTSGSAALASQLTSGNVYFNGTYANAANGGAKVQLYSPTTWAQGSSYSHLGESFNGTVNALMTYSLSYAEANHDPGPVTKGLLKDVGWSEDPNPPTPTHEGSPVLTDYDNDGHADLGIFRSDGSWHLLCWSWGYVGFNSDFVGSQFIVQPGDFDGDRYSDPAVFDTSSGYWYFMSSYYGWNWYYITLPWYISGGTSACGDYDGDRRADPIAYDSSDGNWYILSSRYGWDGHYYTTTWGGPGYSPVCADFDGDRYADPMAYETASGYWYILSSRYNYTRYYQVWFGLAGFTPLSGDFDGDRYADLGIYNKTTGLWAILLSTTGWNNYWYGVWDGSAP